MSPFWIPHRDEFPLKLIKKSLTCMALSKTCFLLFYGHGEEAAVIVWHQRLLGVTLCALIVLLVHQCQFHILSTPTHMLSLLDISQVTRPSILTLKVIAEGISRNH